MHAREGSGQQGHTSLSSRYVYIAAQSGCSTRRSDGEDSDSWRTSIAIDVYIAIIGVAIGTVGGASVAGAWWCT